MHRSAAVASVDLLPYPSQIPYGVASSTYSTLGWSRVNSALTSYTTPQADLRLPKPASFRYTPPDRQSAYYTEAPIRDGLRTPPPDDMMGSTAYPPQYNSYGAARQDNSYSSKDSYAPSSLSLHTSLQSQQVRSSTTQPKDSASSQPYRPRSPNVTQTISESSAASKSMILPSLQIPKSVNDSGGSIGEFAAKITCLFWFESTATLYRAENWTHAHSPIKRLNPDAIPTISFRKWVVTILSTTQVTPSVILLALLFIYRLKTLNPTVKGKAGSEYRLLTVALMLGNKFLDDNTYTNKTWAEVSGISVGEIHVMEVEFLSNMRYSLLTSEEQWEQWQVKLRKFGEYYERASEAPVSLPSPVNNAHSLVLPSAPSLQSQSALTSYPPNSVAYNYNPQWPSHYPQMPTQLPSMPDLVPELSLQPRLRKRSYDEGSDEPPAKRVNRPVSQIPNGAALPLPRQNGPRLPVPNLSVSTAPTMGYPAFANNLPSLPPLSGRAMASVYPATPSWTPQPQIGLTPTGSHSSHTVSEAAYGTPSRRQSPRSVQDLMSMNSSPTSSANFASSANMNSPSFFLQQRNSPYRPVRLPNTLLYPPPSASMHPHVPMSVDQMHYQPLGKRNDYRSGILPDYAHPGFQTWPSNGNTLPQMNFMNLPDPGFNQKH